MKDSTLSKAVQGAIALVFAIIALCTGICTLTWLNCAFGVMALCFARFFYTTTEDGESVKQYIQRKRGA